MPSKKGSGKKPAKPSLDVRVQRDAKLRARVLRNPGLRSKLSDATLAKYRPAAAKQRTLNKRLATPIAPGSSITERDLAHEAQAAQTVRYGPQERDFGQQIGIAQTVERDTGTLYDQYRQALQQHQANVAAFQAGAQQGLTAAAQGITGLSGAQGAELQQAANATAQPGVAPAGDLSSLANQATATRQGLMASFQGQDVAQGAAANTYASNLANVVAPTQKLSALAQARGRTRDVRQKLSDLRTEEGAFNQQFRQERRGEEFKNQLALGALNLQGAKAATDEAAAATTAAANTPEGKAATTSATEEAKQAQKYGYSVHQWRMLGPKGRTRVIQAKSKTSGTGSDTVYTSGPFAGMKKSDVNAMSDSARQKRVDDYNAGKGSGGKPKAPKTKATEDFRRKYGVDLQTTIAHNSGRDAAQNAQTAFNQIGKTVTQADGRKHKVTTDDIVNALRTGTSGASKTSPLWIRVGLELKRYGYITPGTASRLHKAGYSVAQLGFKTGRPPRSGSNIPPGKI